MTQIVSVFEAGFNFAAPGESSITAISSFSEKSGGVGGLPQQPRHKYQADAGDAYGYPYRQLAGDFFFEDEY